MTKRSWKSLWLGAALAELLATATHAADVTPAKTDLGNKCYFATLCSAATATGTCTDGGGNFIVLPVNSVAYIQLSALGSTGTFTLNVQTQAIGRTILGSNTGLELGTDISTSGGLIRTSDIYAGYIWGSVDTCTACSVTAVATVCPR